MSRITRWLLTWGLNIAMALFLVVVFGRFFSYSADEIEGWIVDAESGQAIEGVIAVAYWELKGGFVNKPIRELKVYETVTDAKGRYYFPAWGPKFALEGRLEYASPAVYWFKPGYDVLRRSNTLDHDWGQSKFIYNKHTLKMTRVAGASEEYVSRLSSMSSSLERVGILYDSLCAWHSFPRMLFALDKQEEELARAGVKEALLGSKMRSMESQFAAARCSVKEFLGK